MSNTRLKFGPNLTPGLKSALLDFGFRLHSNKEGEWSIWEKVEPGVLSDKDWKTDLELRLNRIVDAYLDPYSHMGQIKSQVLGMCRSLPDEQKKWCLEWIDETIDRVPPWESESNYEQQHMF